MRICDQCDIYIKRAVESFNQSEVYLLEHDLSEMCICARFAMHLSNEINNSVYHNDYIVDVEYNRGTQGDENRAKHYDGKKIRCDLIVHKRGYDPQLGFDNLICVEMKKSNSRYSTESDEERLTALTNPEKGYGYRAGYMIIANLKAKKLEIKSRFYPEY